MNGSCLIMLSRLVQKQKKFIYLILRPFSGEKNIYQKKQILCEINTFLFWDVLRLPGV